MTEQHHMRVRAVFAQAADLPLNERSAFLDAACRGIAQVYEAGMGEDGQPFFAMEFIRGMPLDEYARSRDLKAPARLEPLARVCDALQHAHEKGVIHRDVCFFGR